MNLQPNHKASEGWETDVTSLVKTFDPDRCSDVSVLSQADHQFSCVELNDSVLPGQDPDVLYSTLSNELEPIATLASPRRQPEKRSDDHASKTLRCLPGSNPEEYPKPGTSNTIISQQGEPYSTSSQAIKDNTRMIKSFWPDLTKVAKKKFPEFANDYKTIRDQALPNFMGARIPVQSGLNIKTWKKYLNQYHDKNICEFLQFGRPLGYAAHTPPETVNTNHPSATAHMPHVEKFIEAELKHGALLGPFNAEPFQSWTRISPLMTRSKKDSADRRIIVDLSFPDGCSVNDGIDPCNHLGRDISYSLPSITDLITRIQSQGPSCLLWKADLTRAYRQLRSDPIDAPLLGIKLHDQIFLDRCPPFGCRSSASICRRMANTIVYIMAHEEHYVIAYLDDFGGCHTSYTEAKKAYDRFKTLTQELGLQLADHKSCSPTTSMNWLGYEVNTKDMSVKIPSHKLEEILSECEIWLRRKHATKKMKQQLAGKLMFL